jgi:hypothetical protein
MDVPSGEELRCRRGDLVAERADFRLRLFSAMQSRSDDVPVSPRPPIHVVWIEFGAKDLAHD